MYGKMEMAGVAQRGSLLILAFLIVVSLCHNLLYYLCIDACERMKLPKLEIRDGLMSSDLGQLKLIAFLCDEWS